MGRQMSEAALRTWLWSENGDTVRGPEVLATGTLVSLEGVFFPSVSVFLVTTRLY